MTPRNNPIVHGLKTAAIGLGLTLLTLQPYSVCPFAVASGIPCPGCGLTRSLVALARGNFAEAWRFHPLGPVVVGVCAGVVVLRLLRSRWQTQVITDVWAKIHTFVWWGALAVVMAVWVARFAGALGGPAEVHSPFELFRR